jgi:hypothetical protein
MTSLEATVDAEKNAIHYSFEIVGDTKPNVKENIGKHAVKEIALSAPTASIGHKVGDIVQFSGGLATLEKWTKYKILKMRKKEP